jgi:hypothetical protein
MNIFKSNSNNKYRFLAIVDNDLQQI